jgi:hypothetical protein
MLEGAVCVILVSPDKKILVEIPDMLMRTHFRKYTAQ